VVALWPGAAAVLQDDFGVPAEKITIIPNGISPDRFPLGNDPPTARRELAVPGLEPDRFTAVFVGALVAEKGVDVAIRAVADLPNVQLLVVGEGTDRGRFESLAQPHATRIVFVGAVDDVSPYYRAADVVLLPSLSESMPATPVEAAMSGRPAIAAAVGAIPEMILDGRTGFVVPVGNADAVREAIARLAADPATAVAMGQAAREHCLDAYSIETVADRWAALLETVMRPRPGS
jgi:glycosyltransferase involved in cell wall biosynthesis